MTIPDLSKLLRDLFPQKNYTQHTETMRDVVLRARERAEQDALATDAYAQYQERRDAGEDAK